MASPESNHTPAPPNELCVAVAWDADIPAQDVFGIPATSDGFRVELSAKHIVALFSHVPLEKLEGVTLHIFPDIEPLAASTDAVETIPQKIEFNNGIFLINPDSREVKIAGKRVEFTQTEFDLLYILAQNADRIISREDVIKLAYGTRYSSDHYESSFSKRISKVRKKLDLGIDGMGDFQLGMVRSVAGQGLITRSDWLPSDLSTGKS